MPLPAAIRSVKAQLRTLSDPDFWSSVLGLVLLMPLGWQIFNHFQQPAPQAQTSEQTAEGEVTQSIDVESPTETSSTAADIDNSAVLEGLLAGGVKSQPSVPMVLTPEAATPTDLEVLAPSNTTVVDTQAILDRYSTGSSAATMTPKRAGYDYNAIAYAARAAASSTSVSDPSLATPNNPAPNALQAAMEQSAQRQPVESPEQQSLMDVKEIALSQPPLPPAPSISDEPATAYPLPAPAPSTALRSLPVVPLPGSSVDQPIVLPTPNALPPSLNSTPTSTQQTKLNPYVPERLYSSPLPALPPSPTGTGWNSNGLPPVPNSGISPQSLNPSIESTPAPTNPPTAMRGVELQPVSLPVQRPVAGTGLQPIQPMQPALQPAATQSIPQVQPVPLPVERSSGGNPIQPIPSTGTSSVELHPTPYGMERLLGGGEINTFANP